MFLKDGFAGNHSKKLLAICAVLIMATVCFSVAAASDESDATDPAVSIREKTMKMEVGKDYTLHYDITPEGTTASSVSWSIDDVEGSKATIKKNDDGSCKVTTKAKGTIKITVSAKINNQDYTNTVTYTIIQQVTKVSIMLDNKAVTATELELNKELQLTAKVEPDNADDKTVTWESSDTSIVSVDSTGKIKALKTGMATIRAISDYDEKKSATCKVTVVNVPVSKITVTGTATVNIGETVTITATIEPANATNKEVDVVVADSTVINKTSQTLNNNVYSITLKGIKDGQTTVTVTTKDGGFKGTCTVTSKTVHVTGVTLNKTELEMEAYGSASQYKLVQTVAPNNATDKTVSWASSDPTVATVDGSGNVTALKPGNASITVTTKDGQHTATCLITVTNELTVEAKITEGGGKAVVTNTNDILAGLKAAEEKGLIPTVLIIAMNCDQVTIPSEIPRFIKTMDDAQMSVQLKVGYLLFDLDAIERIDTSGSNIGVSMATVDLGEKYEEYKPYYAYDINMYVDEVAKPISFGSNPVVVILFYQLKEGEKAEDLMVGFIRDSGKPLKVSDAKYDEELGVIFETNHFSKYAFVFYPADFAAGDYSIVLVIISLIVIIVLLILVTLYVRSYEGISGMFSFRKKYDDEYDYQNQY